MTTRDRVLLTTAAAAMALSLFGTGTADANSRRHVYKPGEESVNATRDSASPGAPEIDGHTLTLGVALAAGGLIAFLGRRRTVRA